MAYIIISLLIPIALIVRCLIKYRSEEGYKYWLFRKNKTIGKDMARRGLSEFDKQYKHYHDVTWGRAKVSHLSGVGYSATGYTGDSYDSDSDDLDSIVTAEVILHGGDIFDFDDRFDAITGNFDGIGVDDD